MAGVWNTYRVEELPFVISFHECPVYYKAIIEYHRNINCLDIL
jgi:hypothetical protein